MKTEGSHHLPIHHLENELETRLATGLHHVEAQARLLKHGANELAERPQPGFLHLLLSQFNNFLVIILIIAAVVSLFLGEIVDATAILAIVVLNAVLGVVQESKAGKALAALKKMSAPNAQVIRDGAQMTIPSRELVPGDIVLLEAGNYIPADLRLVECFNLRIDESPLTGESVPVNKDASLVLDRDIPVGDRKNSAFMGTMVTYGRGKGLVTSTGMHTEIGMIAEMLQSYDDEDTPLQQKLDQLGRWLGVVSLAICGIIFGYGIIRDTQPMTILSDGLRSYLSVHQKEIVELFMTAVSLAIAAVPEGLPAVVTICLALGMQRMFARHALIRKLPAVETLGCATVICSDKTGTLTQNEMTVVQAWTSDRRFEVTGEGYDPAGQILCEKQPCDLSAEPEMALLMAGAALCNDAYLEESGVSDGKATYRMIGDPTEGALAVAAAKAGLRREGLETILPRIAEIPFDSERKRMTTIHEVGQSIEPSLLPVPLLTSPHVGFVKGAPDIVLHFCDKILVAGQVQPLTEDRKRDISGTIHDMAQQALRVLGVSFKPMDEVPDAPTPENTETQLIFLGLLAMKDPARPEAKIAVSLAHTAGLKTVMVTGDYADTARALANEIGLLSPQGEVLSGADMDRFSDEEFAKTVEKVDAYARVSPQHKVKIVEALKSRGHIVAMTGDGVNDAPALKRANIGVAMGITGTDVSKETADMVLTDDNYASIVAAIEEGRIIYANIRKFVFFLVSCNIGEILIIFLSMLFGLPIPLRPIQLLWLNLVTDGAPALALGMERGDPDTMRRPPRRPDEPVINREMLLGIIVQGIVMTCAVLGAFVWGRARFVDNLPGAQTAAFITIVMSQLLRGFTSRSDRFSAFQIGLFSNRWMVAAVGSSMALMGLVIYLPILQKFLGTVPLGLGDWMVLLPLSLLCPVAEEITKWVFRRRMAGKAMA